MGKISVVARPSAKVGIAGAILLLAFAFSGMGAAQKSRTPTAAHPGIGSDAKVGLAGERGSASDKSRRALSHRVLTDVKTGMEEGKLVVSVLANGPLLHQQFQLSNPARLVLDFREVENLIPFSRMPVNGGQVKQIRVRQFQTSNPPITRMVFDLDEDHGKYEILPEEGAFKLVFYGDKDSARNTAAAPELVASTIPILPSPAKPLPGSSRQKASPRSKGELANTDYKGTPVIQDLSVTEIPLSILGTGTKTSVAHTEPVLLPREPPIVPQPDAPAIPPASKGPTLVLTAQEPQFTGHPLTLDLIDISLVDFFRLMAEEGGINIVMDPEIKGTLSIKVVKVPWDQIFDAAMMNNGLDKRVDGNLIRIARKETLKNEAKQNEDLKKASLLAADTQTKIKKLNYGKAKDFVVPLTDQLTVRGKIVIDERTNQIIMTDLPAAIDKMLDLLEKIDVPQPQVEIEARIVSATRDFARDIGVQFGFVQGNLERVSVGGPNTFGTIGGTRPSTTPSSTFAGGNTSTGRGASTGTASQSGAVSTGNGGNYNVNLPAAKAFGGLGISVGNIFDTFLLDAAITAGESKGLAKIISQPKVTAQNNNVATVTQGLKFPVQITANNTVTIQFQSAALTLTVTPQITLEGNIVLDINVQNNTADFGKSVNGVPSIRTSESQTRVLVTDGGTTVIAGILIDDESTKNDRVPGLASLPVLGNLFRRSSVLRTTQEVLFFITPRIVK